MAELKLRSTVDNSGARAGFESLRKMGAGVESQLGSVMKNVGAAFTVGALVQLGREAVELGGKIADLATQTGLSMRQFQAMSLAVRDAGGNEEQLLQVMAKLRDSQAQVIAGNKSTVDSWARLGVSAQDVIRSSPAELLETVSQKFAAAGTDGAAFGAVLDIIGARNAPQLTEALQRLATEGFDGLAASADAAGQMIADSTAKRLDAFGDMLGRVKRALVGSAADLLGWAAGGVAAIEEFRRASREVFLRQVEEGGYWDAYFDPEKLREQLRAGVDADRKFRKDVEPAPDMGGLLSVDDLVARDRRAAEAKAEANKAAAETAAKAEEKAAKESDALRERIAALEQKRQFDRLQTAERIIALEKAIAEQRRISETPPTPVDQPDAVKVPVETPETVKIRVEQPNAVKISVVPTLDKAAAEAALKAAQDALRAIPADAPVNVRAEAQARVQAAEAAIPGAVGERARLEAMERLLKLQDELTKAQDEADKERWAAEERLYDATKRRAAITSDRDRDIEEAKLDPLGGQQKPADRMASIGGFGADSMSPFVRMAERQVQVLERIEDIERRSATALERLEGGYA